MVAWLLFGQCRVCLRGMGRARVRMWAGSMASCAAPMASVGTVGHELHHLSQRVDAYRRRSQLG